MSWNSPAVIGIFILVWVITFPIAWMLLARLVAISVSKQRSWHDAYFWMLFVLYRFVIAAPYVVFLVLGQDAPGLLKSVIVGVLITALVLSLLRFTRTDPIIRGLWWVYGYVYDGLNHYYPYRHLLHQIVELTPKSKHHTVLELGCGTGNVLRALLSEQRDYAQLIGVDNSASMLATARRKLKGFANVKLVQSDIPAYLSQMADHSVDTIVLVNVVYAINERSKFWPELMRVLKTGGQIIATTSDRSGSKQITAEHLAHDSWTKLLHPKLVAVGIIDYFISELSRAGAFHFVPQSELFEEITRAGGRPTYIRRSYGGDEAGVNIIFTIKPA